MHVLLQFIVSVVLSWALTGLLVRALSSGSHRAVPNDRSMHKAPTPVGGGIAIIATLLTLVPLWHGALSHHATMLLAATLLLAVISLLDHYLPVWPLTRLAAQAVAVALALSTLSDSARLAPQAPVWLERGALALAWLWLINLNNFMDGIDGIAGAEAAAVALGVLLVLTVRLARGNSLEATVALVLAGACLGYLIWNWAPARIFMGDVGSIPIGFIMGWLLLDLALSGAWAAALALPLLFVADATLTLLRRLLNGEKPWQAHRKHFYQRAVLGGWTPPRVVGVLTACNAALIALAAQPVQRPFTVLAASVGVAALFLFLLAQVTVPFETRRKLDQQTAALSGDREHA